MFRFSLQRLFVAIAAVAVCIGTWTALGRVFGIYTILLVAIIWISEYLSVRTRLFLSLAAVAILLISGPLAEAPTILLAGDEFSYIIRFPTAARIIRPEFIYAFWLPISAALALSALSTYVRTRLFRKTEAAPTDTSGLP